MAPPTSIEKLPDNVLSEVFVRLLAKEVGQMRCVSKPWNALLSHPFFITSHLNHSLQNNDSVLLFFGSRISFDFDLNPLTARASCAPHLQLPNFLNFAVIPQSELGYGNVIGSVNGLICFFCLTSSLSSSVFHDKAAVHIWNPSRSALLTLPPSPVHARRLKFGFGFDPKTNDYKVLKLTTLLEPPNMEPQCEVYSMKKGSWKSIPQSFPSHITLLEDRDQVCVNGHLHWIGHTEKEGMGKPLTIVAYDLGAEAFIEIPLPEAILYARKTVLGVLGGKLCAMSSVVGCDWEVWVMEEYGVAESWVKYKAFPPFSGDIDPYGFTSKGEFVFKFDKEGDQFGLYDPVAAKTKTFRMTSKFCSISGFVEYVDSLVWRQPPNRDISACDISHFSFAKWYIGIGARRSK